MHPRNIALAQAVAVARVTVVLEQFGFRYGFPWAVSPLVSLVWRDGPLWESVCFVENVHAIVS